MTLAVVVMARNEAQIITRCLSSTPDDSVLVLCDTGSDDGTVDVAQEWAVRSGRTLDVYEHEWVDFSTNRNEALACASGHGEWVLMLDADEVLVTPPDPNTLGAGDVWDATVTDGALTYKVPVLTRAGANVHYEFPTHEFLVHKTNPVPDSGAVILHLGDGGSKADKHTRDLALLADLANEGNPRALFYTAQAHQCLGNLDEALATYRARVAAGGWDEEVYVAQVRIGDCLRDLGRLDEAQTAWVSAFNFRPSRTEGLTRLAALWPGSPYAGVLMGLSGAVAPSTDRLFVETRH